MASQSPLSALLDLLTSSIRTLEATYAKEGLAFPSLDTPFKPNAVDNNPEVLNTARIAVAAAAQIIATIRNPMETVQETATGPYAAAALNVSVDLHVANIIKESGDEVRIFMSDMIGCL
jgi:hypothetical protein